MNQPLDLPLPRPFRLGLIGDFHGSSKRAALRLFCAQARPDVLLSIGDLQDYEPYPVPLYFTRGNHEQWTTLHALGTGDLVVRNLHLLPDATPVLLGDLSVAGLGGLWSEQPARGPKEINREAYNAMASLSVDLVLSHETPLYFSNGRRELTREPLRDLCEIMAPRFWFSGHHHHWDTERLGTTQLVSLGKWPHEWATLDALPDDSLRFARFVPADEEIYQRQMPRWRMAAAAQKDGLNRE